MKRTLARAALAAAATSLTGIAHAVPIYIHFTGTLAYGPQGSSIGTPVSGGFNLETDRLLPNLPSPDGLTSTFLDWEPAGLTAPLAFLDIGAEHFEIPAFASSYTVVSFRDGCNPVCGATTSDGFGIFAESQTVPTTDYVGPWRLASFGMLNDYYTVTEGVFEKYDVIDETVSPIDLVTLPLGQKIFLYHEGSADYANGEYSNSVSRSWGFSIESVTRGVIEPRPVPETGTLALFALALAGVFAVRRLPLRQG